ncbi:MAG: DUF1667 domain-containing protein [Spirochaetales bacterium]|nr:DUF1667 domain-containing protein [Spirochaetales bacterium]
MENIELKTKLKISCIACPRGCLLWVTKGEDGNIEVSGNQCLKGESYGTAEITAPRRLLTSTIPTTGKIQERLSVKTDGEIPKALIFKAMEVIHSLRQEEPAMPGDVIAPDILGTGIDLVSTGVWDGR